MISKLQSTAEQLLRFNSFQFDVRHFGEGRITLWRKRLSGAPREGQEQKRLVIIPGFGDTPLSWLPVVSLVSSSRSFRKQGFDEIIVFGFSGYLGSTQFKAIDTISGCLAVTTALLDELQPKVLVGHSMGGFLSAFYASELPTRRPEAKLENLVLYCPSGITPEVAAQEEWLNVLGKVNKGDPSAFIQGAIGVRPALIPFTLAYDWIYGEFENFLLRKESVSILNSFGSEHEMSERANLIQAPTTLVWGTSDALIPFPMSERWTKALQKSLGSPKRVISIPEASHGLHLDSPLASAKALTSIFLNST